MIPFHRHLILGFGTLFVLCAGFGFWAFFSQISGAVVAFGKVELAHPAAPLQTTYGGKIASLYITEGQNVHAGDVLLRLEDGDLHAELIKLEAQIFELLTRRSRLEAEREDAETLTFPPLLKTKPKWQEQLAEQEQLYLKGRLRRAHEQEQLAQQSQQILDEIQGIEQQITAIETQNLLIQTERKSQAALFEKGLSQASPLLALQREEARLAGQSGALRASRATSLARLNEIEIYLLRLEAQYSETAAQELQKLAPQVQEALVTQDRLLDQLSNLELRAPYSGRIMGLQPIAKGSVLQAAQPLFQIIDDAQGLIIAVKVAPTDIEHIFQHQPVKLVFSGLNSRLTPPITAEVKSLSPDIFSDPQNGSEFYRVEIALSDNELRKLETKILPGMPVEAYLQTQSQSALSWLIQPFGDYFRRALRES